MKTMEQVVKILQCMADSDMTIEDFRKHTPCDGCPDYEICHQECDDKQEVLDSFLKIGGNTK